MIQEDAMGLLSHVIAAGIGYYAGQPDGRRQLDKLRRQAVEYAHGPQAKRLRERGWDMAGEGAHAAKNFASRVVSHKDADPAADVAGTRSGQSRLLWRRGGRTADGQAAATPGTDGAAGTGSPAATQAPPSGTEHRP
ncbi:hypothetical protein [Pseudonocardia alaniniphila]|uniref:Uncharacterized protein n=1 Tax=Pseudonocardia alaniniphila TaxID=75291 RepID=A0ABS9TCI5_9PSEU|nr:hypothetical protein [Pseudonocardia alaniniphila]MCH6166242.1 hypothetical protein [Pseudonocardia alaniniphila]